MDPERWQQVDSLMQAALARSRDERDAYLRWKKKGAEAAAEFKQILDPPFRVHCLFRPPAHDRATPLPCSSRASQWQSRP